MTLNQMQILLLILSGLSVSSGAIPALCSVPEDNVRCVCSIKVIKDPERLECFQATELVLQEGTLRVNEVDINKIAPAALSFLQMKKLIFKNATVPFVFMGFLIPFLSHSNLNEIHFISSKIFHPFPVLFFSQSTIRAVIVEDTAVDPAFLWPSFSRFHKWLFRSLESLSVIRQGLDKINCTWARKVENLTSLDLSENPISMLEDIPKCTSLSFKNLRDLGLRRSGLDSLQSLCPLLSLAPALTSLDISSNNFSFFNFPACLQERAFTRLNLSNSGITKVNSLVSKSLEELDLSQNSLEVFDNPPETLKRLILSNNRLIHLPPLGRLSHLKDLRVDGNQLTALVNRRGPDLTILLQLNHLQAGRNPYWCDCSLRETLVFLENADSVQDEEYPKDFVCASPLDQKGNQIMEVDPETCLNSGTQTHPALLCLTFFMGLLLRFMTFC